MWAAKHLTACLLLLVLAGCEEPMQCEQFTDIQSCLTDGQCVWVEEGDNSYCSGGE